MLNQLVNSKIRSNLLIFFFTKPEKKYYIHEIIKLTGGDAANTHRELKKLEQIGLLISYKEGNLRFYELKKDSVMFAGLKVLVENVSQAQKEKWTLLESDPIFSPSLLFHPYNVSFVNKHLESLGLSACITRLMNFYDAETCGAWMLENESRKLVDKIMNQIHNDHNWLVRYLDVSITKLENFEFNIKKLEKTNLASLSNEDLNKLYQQYFELYGENIVSIWITESITGYDGVLCNYLINYLKNRIIEKKIKGLTAEELFAVLSSPIESGRMSKEYDDLLLIIDKILENQEMVNFFKTVEARIIIEELTTTNADINGMIDNHSKRYGWLGYDMISSCWGKEYFIDLISSLLRLEVNPKGILEKNHQEKVMLRQKQHEYQDILSENNEESDLFMMVRGLIVARNDRKAVISYFSRMMENLFQEICKRSYLTVKQVRFLYPKEMEELLLTRKIDLIRINQRLIKSSRLSEASNLKEKLSEDGQAEELLENMLLTQPEYLPTDMILGDGVCSGRLRSVVRVIRSIEDVNKIIDGEILVTSVASAEIIAAIKRAGALVMEMGGIRSEGAVIARKLNIPCIIGVRFATKLLHDGDLIDIDAMNGKIIVLKKAHKS